MSDFGDLDPLGSVEDAWAYIELHLRQPPGHKLRKLRSKLVLKQGGFCAYCGGPLTVATIDHVIPRSKGGTDEESNLVAACPRCNNAKGDLDVEEFIVLRTCGLI